MQKHFLFEDNKWLEMKGRSGNRRMQGLFGLQAGDLKEKATVW